MVSDERRAHDREYARRYYAEHREAVLARHHARIDAQSAAAKAAGTIGYAAAHDRVERKRGKASDFVCSACQAADAVDWGLVRRSAGFVEVPGTQGYSTFASDYQPLCRSCNRKVLAGEWIKWRDAA